MGRLYFIKNKEKIYIFLIVVFVLLLGVGYAFLNSRLSMQGKIAVRVKEEIRVTNYYLKSTTNGAKEINSEYKKKSIMTNISLPNIDSTIAYQGEITNIGTFAMVLDSINNLVGDNENIVYDISLKVGDLFYGNGEKYIFTVTFKYKDGLTEVPENTKLNSTIGFEFKKKESVLAKGSPTTTVIFNKQLDKSKIESIEFLDYIEPSYEVVDKWDASDKKDGSVMAWTVLDEDTQLYKLYIGGINGVVANTDSSYALCNFNVLTDIFFNDNYDTKYVTTMRSMFSEDWKLENIDINVFNTSNVTNMYLMFCRCKVLKKLDLSNFDTKNVVNMQNMFIGCAELNNLNLLSFDTSKVKDMSSMFSSENWTSSTKIGNIVFGEKFNTSNVTTMSKMFYHCTELTKLDLSNFNTSNVTTMASMFDGCTNLEELDLSSFNTSKVTNMSSMFGSSDMNHTSGMKKINLSSFDTSNVTNMNQMFWRCSNLIELDLSSFNTSKITNMSYFFANCPKLISVNLSSFDTSNVVNMSSMFQGDYSILELNLSNFNTNNVTNMNAMFSTANWTNDMNVKSINLSSFNTSKVTNMSNMFYRCSKLASLDLSSFDTSNVTTMSGMFQECSSIEELDLSNFNTSKVTSMSSMFGAGDGPNPGFKRLNLSSFDTSNVTTMSSMFRKCNKLTELDLSNFDTSNVTNMSQMFYDCTSLSTLNIKKFTFDKVTSSTSMFYRPISGMNITVGSNTAKEFVGKLNKTANITVA